MNVIGVDVGTTSVRLALISFSGDHLHQVNILASHEKPISHKQDGLKFEQSSKEIWQAICECCKSCVESSGIQPKSIQGIAFSATCSLVVEQETSSDDDYDIIMWMDHRAIDEAQAISKKATKVLNQFGGVCSPEFSLAKLVWLTNRNAEQFQSSVGLFELPDWLVYRCIGGVPSESPGSLCCVVCKWGYDADNHCHCDILQALDGNLWKKISKRIQKPGTVSGFLSSKSAMELGLTDPIEDMSEKENQNPSNVIVATSLIDAHSGMLGMLSVPLRSYGIEPEIETTFCTLAGTSSCHMLLSKEKKFFHGIWGPYKDVILDGYYLLEAGQSLTGKLIEICILSHPDGKKMLENGQSMKDIIRSLNDQLSDTASTVSSIHVLPTYHGSRSPLANPRLKGGIYGLSSEGQKGLLDHYIATIESIVYETKLIVETLGIKLDTVLVSGGLMKNDFFMRTLASVLQCRAIKMSLKDVDFMVLGSSLIARHAALSKLNGGSHTIGEPLNDSILNNFKYPELQIEIYQPQEKMVVYHEKKYLCFKEFVEFSKRVDKILHVQG